VKVKKVVIIQNSLKTVRLFRLDYIEKLCMSNIQVIVIAPLDCEYSKTILEQYKGVQLKLVNSTQKSNFILKTLELNFIIFKEYLNNIGMSDVIYVCHFISTFTLTFPTLYFIKKNLVVYIEGLGSFFLKHTKILPFVRYLLKKISNKRVFCNVDERNILGNKDDFVSNGIGINVENYSNLASVCSFKKENEVNLLFIGRLISDKGIFDLIEVFNKLTQRKDKTYVLHIVGEVFKDNPSSLKESDILELESKFKNIKFWGFQNDIRPALQFSDILVLPSRGEGFPVSVMEANAAGIPVVCYDVMGCRSAVESGINGFLAMYGDISSLLDSILNVVDILAKRPEWRMQIKSYAEINFCQKKKSQEFLEFILGN
jgi:glycosyltransferase involved in cell wall biosynthesis